MKRVTRIVIYEGSDDWVDLSLSKSLHRGTNSMGPKGSITILETENDINIDAAINETHPYHEKYHPDIRD